MKKPQNIIYKTNLKHNEHLISSNFIIVFTCLMIAINLSGCKKFIEIDAPITTTNAGNVYANNSTAAAILTGIYTKMSADDAVFLTFGNGLPLASFYPSLSSDELTLFDGATNVELMEYYTNALTARDIVSTPFWSKVYNHVYVINSAIEGLNNSNTLTPAVKAQLLGEAYFIRAFCYFYLINFYGNVPLLTGSDYNKNALAGRATKDQIYTQIKADLAKAEDMLSANYLDGTLLQTVADRVRPTKFAAAAFLARVYLYTNDYANAEIESSKVINNTALFETVSLDKVFLKNSRETIWALQPTGTGIKANTGEATLFILPSGGPSGNNVLYLSSDLMSAFESGDQRLNSWIESTTVQGVTYNYPYKYKIGQVVAETAEFPIVMRLAEQYLIRAESRAQEGNLSNAIDDLDVIRRRAGLQLLKNTDPKISKENLITAILKERRVELFTEWGHRWFDLKRTNTIDQVMTIAAPKKGSTWDSRQALYPIPVHEIQNNPNLLQNPGY